MSGVMLAEPHKSIAPTVEKALALLAEDGDWWFDLKWDGVRCMAIITLPEDPHDKTGNRVALVNRNGVDITHRYPDVCAALEDQIEGFAILDGEIVALDSSGRPDFEMLSRRDRVGSAERALTAAKSITCTFVAFDLIGGSIRDEGGALQEDSKQYHRLPWITRRVMLEELLKATAEGVLLSPASANAQVMWDFVKANDLEGLIAKRVTSAYQSGRSSSWVKLKPTSTLSAIITDWEPGKGKHTGLMGALHLGLIGDASGEIVPIGKVGTGFTDAERLTYAQTLSTHGVSSLVVDVEYQGLTKDGKLRFPAYRGLRNDVPANHCTVARQLGS